jgi:hypothetical protein
MKYILMMSGTKADFDWYARWSSEEIEAHAAFLRDFGKNLKDSGKFVSAEGLSFPQEAKMVRSGGGGEPITDGVFPEAKEFLAGYFIVEVESAEEAYRLAAQISAAPGPKDRGNQPIEVREVLGGPPEESL